MTLAPGANGEVVTSECGTVLAVDVRHGDMVANMDDRRLERFAGEDLDADHWLMATRSPCTAPKGPPWPGPMLLMSTGRDSVCSTGRAQTPRLRPIGCPNLGDRSDLMRLSKNGSAFVDRYLGCPEGAPDPEEVSGSA